MSGGWRYSVRVPDFTKEEQQADDVIVSYQVDVLVQSPGSKEPAPPSSVWRRFSEFRQLHSNLKAAYPDLFKGKQLDPPPKKIFGSINDNDRKLNERRVKLEQWLWKLLRFPELAQSRDMKLFLQLNLAMRAANTGMISPRSSVTGGFGEFAIDERSDTDRDSEVSSAITNFSTAHTETASLAMSGLHSARSILDPYGREHTEPLRMGLKVEQRSDLKRVLADLSQHIEKASRDLQEANAECAKLRQDNQRLEELGKQQSAAASDENLDQKNAKLAELEEELEARAKSLSSSRARVEELEGLIEVQSKRLAEKNSDTEESAQESSKALSRLKQELETLSRANAELVEKSTASKQEAKQNQKLLAKEIAKLRGNTSILETELASLRADKSSRDQAEVALQESELARANLDNCVKELQGKLAQHAIDHERVLREKESAEQALESRKVEDTSVQIGVLESTNRELSKHIELLESKQLEREAEMVQDLKGKITALEQETSELRDEYSSLSSERDDLKKQMDMKSGLEEEVEALQSQLRSRQEKYDQLSRENTATMAAAEKAEGLISQVQDLQLVVERVKSEKLDIDVQLEGAVARADSLAKEIDGLEHWKQMASYQKIELEKLESRMESVMVENAALKETQAEQARLLEQEKSHRESLMAGSEQLKAEKSQLASSRDEQTQLKSELESMRLGNGDMGASHSHDDVLKEYEELKTQISENGEMGAEVQRLQMELEKMQKKAEHLERENAALPAMQDNLRVAQIRAHDAMRESSQADEKIKELEAKVKTLESSSGNQSAEDPSISHIAEVVRLQSDIELLKADNAALREHASNEQNGNLGTPTDLTSIAEIIRSMHADVQQCSASVPGLSGQTSIDPSVATDLMDKVADCNGKLELIAARAKQMRTSSENPPEIACIGQAVADVLGELVSKCREINEIRVDQLLIRAEAPSTPTSSGTTPLPIPSPQKNPGSAGWNRIQRPKSQSFGSRFSPDGQGNRRGMLSRLAGSGGNAAELERGGSVGEGDSKVRNFFEGLGSKVSSGAMNFMQRGNPNYIPDSQQVNSLQQPLRPSPDPNSDQQSNGN